jgi:hypothetical protein
VLEEEEYSILIYVQKFMKYLVYPWGVFVCLVHNII